MRRKDREQNRASAIEVLKNCFYATLATVSSDGSPYCVPISTCLVIEDGREAIYFHCAVKGKKTDNIAGNPRICLSCVSETENAPSDYTVKYKSAVVFGECRPVAGRAEKIKALRAICKKYAPEYMDMFEDKAERAVDNTAIYKIIIEEITGKANL